MPLVPEQEYRPVQPTVTSDVPMWLQKLASIFSKPDPFVGANPMGGMGVAAMKGAGKAAAGDEIEALAKKWLQLHQQGGGGSTFNVASQKSLAGKPGFAVGIYPNLGKELEGAPTVEALQNFLLQNRNLLQQPQLSAGSWENAGKTYLDVSATPRDFPTAYVLGRRADQKAIFDLSKLEEIPLPGNMSPVTPRASAIPQLQERLEGYKGDLVSPKQAIKHYERGAELNYPNWYDTSKARPFFNDEADLSMWRKFYAVTSPNSDAAASNIDFANRAFALWKQGKLTPENIKKVGLGPYEGNILRVLGGKEISGPKVWNFEGLTGGNMDRTAIDRYVGLGYVKPSELAKYPKAGKGIAVGEDLYPVIEERMRKDANLVGVELGDFQQNMWRGVRRMLGKKNGQEPLGELMARRFDAQGIKNVSEWAKKVGLPVGVVFYALGKSQGGDEAPMGQSAGPRQ